MKIRTRASAPVLRPVLGLAVLGLSLTSLLGGCGGSPSEQQMEARIAALEAKAEAADKRSRRALSMAAEANPAAHLNPNNEDEFLPDSEGQDENIVTDGSADDPSFDNQIEPPPAPLIPQSN